MDRTDNFRRSIALLILLTLVPTTGCLNLVSTLLYPTNEVPARYGGMKEKKVAVVCIASPSFRSETDTSRNLATMIEKLLGSHVPDVKIISQQKIDDWQDTSNWDRLDARKVGKGVGADIVLAIDLAHMEVQEHPSMYQGKADFSVSVYDMNNKGELVFESNDQTIEFPANGPLSSASLTEDKFRRKFLQSIAVWIAHDFYKHDAHDYLALDETFVTDR
ncbi:hypothetical protein [Blastopirellula marina]|uniref:Uncharacterized protein n=1 Tax=Blastopirellula marina TaxID=124 RepID=A0A2S8GFX1_9BACT|nr:hypothetical protein [Blastopirellula marina]PQO43377.1 hypothetical protein C5Y98_00230 [Blastopirellula marina]PTL46691.1 hypothetical protein C5Y97_00230 [Blastopirellula marina]